MILVADSGSTKTDWVLKSESGELRFRTIGYNPYFTGSEDIYKSLAETLAPGLNGHNVQRVYFYGAGCSNDTNIEVVKQALNRCFKGTEVWVGHDMLAAARALLGNRGGFAAILGTGSNTCLYDGEKITRNIDSLGYLLGDEGSGSYIGKKIIRDYLRGFLPVDLEKRFREKYNLSDKIIFDTLYNQPFPNRYLANFCQFAYENKSHAHIRRIVRVSFNDFFRHLVIKYPSYQEMSFNCVGTVGHSFSEILEEVVGLYNMKMGSIIRSPIEQLVEYHQAKQK
jgi:glucosamine kinase